MAHYDVKFKPGYFSTFSRGSSVLVSVHRAFYLDIYFKI